MTSRRIRTLVLLTMTVAPFGRPAGAQASADTVRVITVQPASATRGVLTEFKVDVEIAFHSAPEGQLTIGFNTDDNPDAFRMRDSRKVRNGTQRLSFIMHVVPVDWQERGQFALIAHLGPPYDGPEWRPTVSARTPIQVTP